MKVCIEISTLQARFAGIAYYGWFLANELARNAPEIELSGFDGLAYASLDHARLDYLRAVNDGKIAPPRIDKARLYGRVRNIGLVRGAYRAVKAMRFRQGVDGCDVFHALNFLPPSPRPDRVVPLLHDMSHERFPETHPAERVAWMRRGARHLNAYPVLNTITQFSADEIAEIYDIERDRLRITNPGRNPIYDATPLPGDQAVLSANRLTAASYFLAVGTLEPRKNLKTVLEAFRALPATLRRAHPIVVIGQLGWGDAGLAAGAELVAEGSLRVLGYQPDDHLAALYRQSRTLLFPSIYEGFGMPTVEALASGKRPILSDIPVMHEIAGAEANFVEAKSVEAWAVALKEAIDDSRHDDGGYMESACARGRLYDWRRNAAETRAIYAEAAASFGTAS
ncbi:MAG: glycosyltransferase family 4 protein [Fulvimarina manganoxydans]|uniref:glycosyltransferase family 4 protein n=1 Tax=Fulvimarina manganoxydans TaxID=937218 RepID=UPI00235402B5|nr:glycosyltransferase family 1 protein [Fulvimarina manganoxydans]MCK5932390.1 glycosyltransferase family 4 protein [Fulvimarina manganoxydans]